MVLEHIPQRSSLFIVAAPVFHAQRFRRRNLNVVNVAPVPNGFNNRVGEPERHDILHRLFAEIMVNAVNLLFQKHVVNGSVQINRGL